MIYNRDDPRQNWLLNLEFEELFKKLDKGEITITEFNFGISPMFRTLYNFSHIPSEEEMSEFVYIIENENSCIKIGKSKNPELRIRHLITQGNLNLKNKYVSNRVKKDSKIESKLHKEFKDKRLKGEWFDISFISAVNKLKEIYK